MYDLIVDTEKLKSSAVKLVIISNYGTNGAISVDECDVFYIGLGNYPFTLRSN